MTHATENGVEMKQICWIDVASNLLGEEEKSDEINKKVITFIKEMEDLGFFADVEWGVFDA